MTPAISLAVIPYSNAARMSGRTSAAKTFRSASFSDPLTSPPPIYITLGRSVSYVNRIFTYVERGYGRLMSASRGDLKESGSFGGLEEAPMLEDGISVR